MKDYDWKVRDKEYDKEFDNYYKRIWVEDGVINVYHEDDGIRNIKIALFPAYNRIYLFGDMWDWALEDIRSMASFFNWRYTNLNYWQEKFSASPTNHHKGYFYEADVDVEVLQSEIKEMLESYGYEDEVEDILDEVSCIENLSDSDSVYMQLQEILDNHYITYDAEDMSDAISNSTDWDGNFVYICNFLRWFWSNHLDIIQKVINKSSTE